MTYNDGCSRLRLAALVLAMIWLSGCGTGASDVSGLGSCPPVVAYSREFQARAAEELALLPDGSAIEEMLADYAMMREQGRACGVPKLIPLRRRQQAMPRFRRMRSLQKFAVHASFYNHFNQESALYSRHLFKANRTAALGEWRGLGAA